MPKRQLVDPQLAVMAHLIWGPVVIHQLLGPLEQKWQLAWGLELEQQYGLKQQLVLILEPKL